MYDLPRFALAKVALHFSLRAQRPLLKEGRSGFPWNRLVHESPNFKQSVRAQPP